ncbi:MAG: hypothetical protein IJ751_00840 [Oscillospiraceae bacterium]|nr:hypothetical protein [Oscillospiraceae bacterium]
MAEIIMFCLFGGGILLAALSGLLRRRRALCALLAAVCVAVGVLAGLALGTALETLLTPVLLVCAAAMAALLFGRGGGHG